MPPFHLLWFDHLAYGPGPIVYWALVLKQVSYSNFVIVVSHCWTTSLADLIHLAPTEPSRVAKNFVN